MILATHPRAYHNSPATFSARPSLPAAGAVPTGTADAVWLAPHLGQNAAPPNSDPHALQNAICKTSEGYNAPERNKRGPPAQCFIVTACNLAQSQISSRCRCARRSFWQELGLMVEVPTSSSIASVNPAEPSRLFS